MPTQRYTLVDDRLVEDTLLLRRTLGMPALKRRDPLLRRTEAFGSVLRDDGGQWRMWYCQNVTRDPAKDVAAMEGLESLGLSKDGLAWDYPKWGVVEEGGSTDNSIVMGSRHRDARGRYLTGFGGPSGFCVIDAATHPHPHARGRFTALYDASPVDSIGGICLAYSDDGVHWTAYPENPVLVGAQDTQNCFFYDPRLGKYVCYQRPQIHTGMAAHANRKIARVESEDLVHWSVSRIVLDTDERDAPGLDGMDEPGMRGPRGRDKQFQGITVFPYLHTYLAFTWFYDVRAGVFTNELLHSDDGVFWKREALREPFIADGRPEGFAGKIVVPMASPPVLQDDELYMYMSSSPYSHHEIAEAVDDVDNERRQELLERNDLMVLSLPRDRWVCYEAGEREGELLTTPIDWDGDGSLRLNATIEAGGYIRLAFEDELARPIHDYHLDEIPPITGPLDALDHLLEFGPQPIPQIARKTIVKLPAGGPVRMRLFMKRAKLYGWSMTSPTRPA